MPSAKDEILGNIRQALSVGNLEPVAPDLTSPIYAPLPDEDLVVAFAQMFKEKGGELFYASSEEDLSNSIKTFLQGYNYKNVHAWDPIAAEFLADQNCKIISNDKNLEDIEVGFTICEMMIARTGSIVVSSAQVSGRRLTIYPPHHVVIAAASQVVRDIDDALKALKKLYPEQLPSMVSMITGPSRTADIEKTLVLGAHGPKRLTLFLLDDLQ
jgi:L-lactate dehydrogenase complex protein LldG